MKDMVLIVKVESGVLFDDPVLVTKDVYYEQYKEDIDNNDESDTDYYIYIVNELLQKANYI